MTEQLKPTAYELYRSYKCARKMGAPEPKRRNMAVERIAFCKGERKDDTAAKCGWSETHRDRADVLARGRYVCPSDTRCRAQMPATVLGYRNTNASRMNRESARLRNWESHNPRLAEPDVAARILRWVRPREFVAGVMVIPGNGAPYVDSVAMRSETHKLFNRLDWKNHYSYNVIVCGDRWVRGCEN